MTMKEVQEEIYNQVVDAIIKLLEAQEKEREEKQKRGEELDPHQYVGIEAMLFGDGHLSVFPSMRIQQTSGTNFHPGSTVIVLKDVDAILQADDSFREKFSTSIIGGKALRIREVATQ